MTQSAMSKRKKLLFAFVCTGLLFLAAEVVCRLVGAGGTGHVAGAISDWHEMPDGRTFWVVRGPNRNSDGMRDREHAVAKPPDTFRIVCLGDSVTVGFGVKRSQAYPHILESFLTQTGLSVEVLNIAVSGWSTLQQVTAYRAIARKYKPDQVILGICLNDVAEMRNNLLAPPPAPVRVMLRYSALVRWITGGGRREIQSVRELFDTPDAQAVREGWRRVTEEITALRDDTMRDGSGLSVVVFPFRFQLAPDAPKPIAQARLLAFCLDRGIPFLDLLPTLRAIGPEAMIDASHLSPTGAEAVARAIVQWGKTGCASCGYDLSGFSGDRCPKCGRPVER